MHHRLHDRQPGILRAVGDGLGFVRTDAVWSAAGPACCHDVWENRYVSWDGTTFVAQSVSSRFAELGGMPAGARP
jgi:hypothetical protein